MTATVGKVFRLEGRKEGLFGFDSCAFVEVLPAWPA